VVEGMMGVVAGRERMDSKSVLKFLFIFVLFLLIGFF